MGFAGVLAQCALDFLIEERCHACGSAFQERRAAPAPPLAAPVDVLAFARFRLTTRLLCPDCAIQVLRWNETILLRSHDQRDPEEALRVRAAFVTDSRLLAVIHLLKFGRRESIAPWLARAMMLSLPAMATHSRDGARAIVPVPMDRTARAQRGFNQAESIARTLAKEWRLPLAERALVKVRRTRPQSALGRDERLINLAGAFEASPSMIRGKKITLVDDLVTTGVTVHACARALRRAGAREVDVVCAGYRDEAPSLPTAFLQS
jgi:ComF family protein